MKHCPKYFFILILSSLLMVSQWGWSQSAPAEEENIPHLVTFGADAERSWGDDDFCQIFFLLVPSVTRRSSLPAGI